MKSFLYLIILLAGTLSAQPAFQMTDITPTAGETFKTLKFFGNYNQGNYGANITWDFSNIPVFPEDTFIVNVVAPLSTTLGNQFSNATVAVKNEEALYTYLKATNSSLVMLGEADNEVALTYSDNKELYAFPLTFGNTTVDNYFGEASDAMFSTSIQGTITSQANAYGTLILPIGTFTNVMRITTIDSFITRFEGMGMKDSFEEVHTTHQWYAAGIHYPLLSLKTIKDINGENTENFYLETEPTTGIVGKENTLNVSLFPNPFTNWLFIKTTLSHDAQISIYDITGKIVLSEKTNTLNNTKVYVGNLLQGVYVLKVTQGDKVFAGRIMKQ
jgi:hypothetical protein